MADGLDRVPVCFVVDEEAGIRHFLSLVLHGSGIDAEGFADGKSFAQAIAERRPDLVFLDIGRESSDAIASILMLAERGHAGFVQLMSGRGLAVLEHVKQVGLQHRLQMLPVLQKPFETSAIAAIMQQVGLGHRAPVAGRIGLDEAIASNWVEFWHQPKIDLRKKRLTGAEAFARARHPQFGILPPDAFMTGATQADLIALAELALVRALAAATGCAALGINLRFAVNIPANALAKLPIVDIVRAHRPPIDNWAGLLIDVTAEEIVTDLALAARMAKKLALVHVELAIDDVSGGHSSLARLKELPFTELKLARSLVSNCGTDKDNAQLCRSAIELAHNFACVATAIGIETASDAAALIGMNCDMGQGFLLGRPMPEAHFMSLLRQRTAGQGRPAAAAVR